MASIITEMELLSHRFLSDDDNILIKSLISRIQIVNISENIKELAIEARIKSGLKLPDAIISATATSLDIPLLTADLGFSKLEDENVIIYVP